jgi:hypothetical protein
MKKILLIIMLLLVTGCTSNDYYSGKVTEESKKYLDKGYVVNIYRGSTPLGNDEENYGKGYINMTFNVITDYISISDYNPEAGYNIKKKTVSNIRVIRNPKKGVIESLIGDYNTYGEGIDLVGTKNKFETNYETPHNSGVQSSIAVNINQIALFDSSNYGYYETPSINQVYSDLDITRENVELVLGFRVELLTVDNQIYYKDYEITLPPVEYDIAGSEFHIDKTIVNQNDMEPFMQK